MKNITTTMSYKEKKHHGEYLPAYDESMEKPLSDELRSIGYNPAKHSFSRNEVKVIVKHLGEP